MSEHLEEDNDQEWADVLNNRFHAAAETLTYSSSDHMVIDCDGFPENVVASVCAEWEKQGYHVMSALVHAPTKRYPDLYRDVVHLSK